MINFEIGEEPQINDVVTAVVQRGDGRKNVRLIIVGIEGDTIIACEPCQDGDTIKLNTPNKHRIPRKYLVPESRRREWMSRMWPS